MPLAVRIAVVGLGLVGAALAVDAQVLVERRDVTTWGLPIATNTLLQTPDAYYGKLVNLSVGVENVLSRTAFIVDQRRAAGTPAALVGLGKPVLVIFPEAETALTRNATVLVRGQVIEFGRATLARAAPGYELDIAPSVVEHYLGTPVVVANNVVDAQSQALGRRPSSQPAP